MKKAPHRDGGRFTSNARTKGERSSEPRWANFAHYPAFTGATVFGAVGNGIAAPCDDPQPQNRVSRMSPSKAGPPLGVLMRLADA